MGKDKFEAALCSGIWPSPNLTRLGLNTYADPIVQSKWEGWQLCQVYGGDLSEFLQEVWKLTSKPAARFLTLSRNQDGDDLLTLTDGTTVLLKDVPGWNETRSRDILDARRFNWLMTCGPTHLFAISRIMGGNPEVLQYIDAQLAKERSHG